MTGVRTKWHLADLGEDDDPFETVVHSTGVVLDLTASEDVLAEQLAGLLRREQRMYDHGVTCQLKWDGQNCLNCPVATLDPEEKRSRLCRLGKDQRTGEDRLNELAMARLGPVRELVATMDESNELAEIPDDLSELLAQVGL